MVLPKGPLSQYTAGLDWTGLDWTGLDWTTKSRIVHIPGLFENREKKARKILQPYEEYFKLFKRLP